MLTFLRFTLLLLLYFTISGCSQPVNIDSLEIKNDLIYKDGKKFSGQTYAKSGKGIIAELSSAFAGDSVIYSVNNGFPEKIQYFKNEELIYDIEQDLIEGKVHRNVKAFRKINNENQVHYEASYIDGKLNGETIEWAFDGEGLLSTGNPYKIKTQNFKNDFKNGQTIIYYNNGNKKELENYKNDLLSGEKKIWFRDGNLQFVRLYENNNLLEEKEYYRKAPILKTEKIYSSNQIAIESGWSFNEKLMYHKVGNQIDSTLLDGYYEFIDDGKEVHVNYDKGVKNGSYESFYPFGDIFEKVNYIKGERNGKYQKWYTTGQLAEEVTYSNGKKQGLEKKMYDTGKTWHLIEFKDGLKSGEAKLWYKNGELAKEENFLNGVNQGITKEYYNSGKKWKTISYTQDPEGTKGLYKSWYKDGAKAEEYEILNGESHGYYKKWWGNGKIRLHLYYKNGLKDGVYKNWMEDGTLYRETFFVRDNEQKNSL